MTLDELQTPAVVVDEKIVERNCSAMRRRAAEWGVRLRPHVKTHKTIEGARLQLGSDKGPIAVSTLAEAEFFADEGFEEITWAVPLDPAKATRVVELARRMKRLTILIDHEMALDAMIAAVDGDASSLEAMIKIDSGYHRAGLAPDDETIVQLARRIAEAGQIRFGGLLTHAGHSYHARSIEEIQMISREEVDALQRAARMLEEADIEVAVLSAGSTPTATRGDLRGVNEIRPGNYIFFDTFQAELGSCSFEDCAMSVLTTVIGSYPARGKAIVDAGAIALSKDRGTGRSGYGIVADGSGCPIEQLKLETLSQEHGEITGPAEIIETLTPGRRLRIFVNHSCLTAANFERYWTIRDNSISGHWNPVKGW